MVLRFWKFYIRQGFIFFSTIIISFLSIFGKDTETDDHKKGEKIKWAASLDE